MVATESINLAAQFARAALIAAGECNRKSELELLELMFTGRTAALDHSTKPTVGHPRPWRCVNSCIRSGGLML
jgi:hypothetical protein